jgi:hypothetical protein
MTRFDRVDRQILQGHDDGGKTKKRLLVSDSCSPACCNSRPFALGHGPFQLAPPASCWPVTSDSVNPAARLGSRNPNEA